ncbi:hypothetical protein GCM10009765_84740 [Fodinicola feengrottensis]|uniref:Uncharacterized protein n=1 Tax=Fodinicola feengrottensis TaxID=435914 RepID=A0ABP4VHV1_9ACTN
MHQQVDDNGNSWWVATNCDPNGWGQDYQWNQDGQVHGTCIADQRTGLLAPVSVVDRSPWLAYLTHYC